MKIIYERELEAVKAESAKDGVSSDEWRKWANLMEKVVKHIGFRNARDVRRVAMVNGHFEG